MLDVLKNKHTAIVVVKNKQLLVAEMKS